MHRLQSLSQIHGFDLGMAAVLIRRPILRGKISKADALQILDRIIMKRGWLGRPIYRAYKKILEQQ